MERLDKRVVSFALVAFFCSVPCALDNLFKAGTSVQSGLSFCHPRLPQQHSYLRPRSSWITGVADYRKQAYTLVALLEVSV